MASNTINITGNLRKILAKSSRGRDKFSVELVTPDILFRFDERHLAGITAATITEVVRENMEAGRRPNGKPFPRPDQATTERRDDRERQFIQGAQRKAPHMRDKSARRLERRITAPKLGKFPPGRVSVRNRRALESGMLAKSAVVVPDRDGKWNIFFASKRGNADKHGTAPVERAFKGVIFWDSAAMRQPKVQAALEQFGKIIASSRRKEALQKIFKSLKGMSQNTQGIVSELEQAGEDR